MSKTRLLPAMLACSLLSAALPAEVITWTNGGGDNSWTNSANWNPASVPGAFDDVIFDGSSTDDCSVPSGSYEIQSLAINSGYTGTLTFSNINLTITNELLLNDGTFNPLRSNITIQGDLIRTSGTNNSFNTCYTFDGPADFDVDFGPDMQEVSSLSFNQPTGVNGSVSGDILLDRISINSDEGSSVTLTGNITTSVDAFSNSMQNTALIINDGAVLDLRTVSSWGVFGTGIVQQLGTGRIRRQAFGLAFTDLDGNVIESYNDSTDIYITLIDEDENIDAQVQDTTSVTVTNMANGDIETITLTEVDEADSIFRTVMPLSRTTDSSNSGDGIIQMATNDDLQVSYVDPQDPDDTLISNLIRSPFIWDGGGSDNDFHTAENWDVDRVPSQFDDVVFNGTSDKISEMTQRDVYLRDLTIESDYEGEFIANQFAINQILNANSITQNGGTFTMNRRDFRLSGDFRLTSGTVNGSRFSRITVSGDGATYDPGMEPFDVAFLFAGGEGTQVLGDTNIHTLFDVSSGNITLDGSIVYLPNTSGFQMRTNSILNIADGGLLDIRESLGSINNNGVINLIGSGNYLYNSESAILSNETGNRVANIPAGAGFYVTIEDQDENLNGQMLDTTEVTVSSVDTGDSEMITLTETGNKTGVFRNIMEFPTEDAPANPNDGILQQNGTEDLNVEYIDNEFPDDGTSSTLLGGLITWDGGGADNLWTTPENWSNDSVPGEFDAIVFDDTSTKDSDATGAARIFNNLEIKSGYTGTISFDDFVKSNGNFIQNGGTVEFSSGVLEIGADLLLDGTDFITDNTGLSANGPLNKVFDLGPEVRTFRSLFTQGDNPTSYVLVVKGDAIITGSGTQINQFEGEVIIDGSLTYPTGSNQFRNNARVPVTITDGSVLDVREVVEFENQSKIIEEGTGRIRRNADGIAFTNNMGVPADLIIGQELYIRVIDVDENIDVTESDTTTVLLENLNNGDTETIILTEENTDSPNFLNATGIAIISQSATAEDGILQAAKDDVIRVTYTDNEDPVDTLSTEKVIQTTPPEVWVVQ